MSSDLTNARKRKLADALTPAAVKQEAPSLLEAESVPAQVKRLVDTITGFTQGTLQVERVVLRRAAHGLAELAKTEENVDQVVAGDAIQAVVPLLTFYADVDGEGPTYHGEVEISLVLPSKAR